MDRIALYLTKVWPPNRLPSTRVRHSCNLPGKKLGFWATYLPIFQTPGVQRYSPIRKHRLHLCLSVPLKETHFLLLPCANSHQLPKQWALPAWLRPGCPPMPLNSSVWVQAVQGYTDEVPFLQIVPHCKLIFRWSPSLKRTMQEKLHVTSNEKTLINSYTKEGSSKASCPATEGSNLELLCTNCTHQFPTR